MSSMFANQPPSLHNTWSKTGCGASYIPNHSHERRDNEASADTWFPGGLPTPPATKAMSGLSAASTIQGLQPTYIPPSRYHQNASATASNMQHSLSQPSYDSHGSYPKSMNGHGGYTAQAVKNTIASHLQIPESVNKSKGSLAEFAAEITCLFWFESSETLELAEDTPKDGYVTRGLVADAAPSTGFRKWVTTILSTTQVSKEVILLALMFIYRLKKFNPSVSGKRGSEFRLLTIALMLGNKFLDDNTYTNKTWAEVSGISVTEIHIMEVEFLSNMRYELYASESDWFEWKEKLGRLGAFYEKASRLPQTDVLPVTPTAQSFGHKLPSPPSTHGNSIYTASSSYANLPNPMSTAPHLPRSPLRQQRIPSVDALTLRKRSLDMGSEAPPAKRMHYPMVDNTSPVSLLTPQSYISNGSGSSSVPPYALIGSSTNTNSSNLPRLPVPRLPVQMADTQLAPLNVPVSRAMSSVYPQTTSAAWSQPITPVSAGPLNLYHNPIPNFGDASRPQSNIASQHTSPNGYNTSTPVLPGLSPSYFLGDRQSPYRPVRNVNTLLHPPPSAALQNTVRNIPAEQIRYQPLSKGNLEHRSGPVPYLQADPWQQSNTPLAQKYPYRF